MKKTKQNSLKEEFNLKDKIIFGTLQPNDLEHFSPIILHSYKFVMDDNTAFILLGGHENYLKQAAELKLKNFFSFPYTEDEQKIDSFLESLDVYAHGSPMGSQMLLNLQKVLKFGIPIVSHWGNETNDQLAYTVGSAGVIHGDPKSYCFEFWNLKKHNLYRTWRSEKAIEQYENLVGKKIVEKNEWLDDWLVGE